MRHLWDCCAQKITFINPVQIWHIQSRIEWLSRGSCVRLRWQHNEVRCTILDLSHSFHSGWVCVIHNWINLPLTCCTAGLPSFTWQGQSKGMLTALWGGTQMQDQIPVLMLFQEHHDYCCSRTISATDKLCICSAMALRLWTNVCVYFSSLNLTKYISSLNLTKYISSLNLTEQQQKLKIVCEFNVSDQQSFHNQFWSGDQISWQSTEQLFN